MARAGRLGGLLVAAPALVLIGAGAASAASSVDYTEVPLTQQEIDQHWVTDRSAPSGGHESVTFDGRTDVLEVRVDPANRSTDSGFYYTEGLKRDVPDVDAARIDLYVDPEWTGLVAPDVRAGFWGVGEDADSTAAAYPIVEFTNAGDFTGWRVWDSETGWVNQPDIPVEPGWTTLELVLDQADDSFDVSIDGHVVDSPALGSEALGSVIVNSYNYGPGTAPYEVRWSDFGFGDRVTLASREQCRDGGWDDFGFANQGRCVASLVASDRSPH